METAKKIQIDKADHRLLWRNFIEGEDEAITAIYKSFVPNLVFTAYHYLKDKQQAQDAVGDVFERLLLMDTEERRDKLGEVDEKLDTFLTVIVKNRCLNMIKIENNRRGILQRIGHRFSSYVHPLEPTLDDLSLLLNCLSERQHQFFEMHLEGYKNAEIAEQLEIKEQTVKNTLVTAKKNLRTLYYTFME